MSVIGIIGEYNPFHSGHLLHFQDSLEAVGDAAVVCVVSGDFVQRGEPAVFNKHARAAAAAECGADLVFELPLPWCVSSAEGFARGAVGLLGSLGVVTHLCFGSESGDIAALQTLAEAALEPANQAATVRAMAGGLSYPRARQEALAASLGSQARLLETPNNILAVEYLKALMEQRLGLEPVTTARRGAAHDGRGEGAVRSASELRTRLELGKEAGAFMPAAAWRVFSRELEAGRGPITASALELALLSRLRGLPPEAFARLPDASEGLGNRIYAAVREEPSLDALLSAVKTKRYALSRLRRMLMCAALGVEEGMNAGTPPYARLLAFSRRGRELLGDIAARGAVPVVTKPAAVNKLDGESRQLFKLGADARDLYVLGYEAVQERRGGGDWRQSPAQRSENVEKP